MRRPDPKIGQIVVTEEQIQDRVAELGRQITKDYADRTPILVAVLKGAFVFMGDLVRNIDAPVETDFMAVASYGSATKSSGVVRIIKDLEVNINGRDVIIVEDIVDSGLTLAYLKKYLKAREPASMEVCSLLVKKDMQRVDPEAAYVGFNIPNEFVVGYGLDVDEKYRNLPYVAVYLGEEK